MLSASRSVLNFVHNDYNILPHPDPRVRGILRIKIDFLKNQSIIIDVAKSFRYEISKSPDCRRDGHKTLKLFNQDFLVGGLQNTKYVTLLSGSFESPTTSLFRWFFSDLIK
jgi:hypothetical protein